jgi:hypothetical protein
MSMKVKTSVKAGLSAPNNVDTEDTSFLPR